MDLSAAEADALRAERGIGPEDDFFTPATHDIDFTYKGISYVRRERYVRLNPDSELDPNSETTVETEEHYDAFGRLTLMTEFSGSSFFDTVYKYDVGDHLVEAKQRLPLGQNQIRTWTWDQRDFMSHEFPVEKDGCMFYGAIDALGKVGRTKDGNQPDGVQDLRIRYDRAGRLTKINEKKGDKRLLKRYIYGTQSIGGDWAKGKLVYARNHDYHVGADFRVKEEYQYRGVGGRPSWKRTTWLRECAPDDPHEPGNECETTGYDTESVIDYRETYDDLGNTITINYPDCAPGTKECVPGESFTIYNDYKDGFLTKVRGPGRNWATDITYHDNQMLAGFKHSNGVWDHYGKDPKGMPRVNSIYSTGTASWDTGTYGYDGSGNIDGIGAQRFLYDRVNRLKEAKLQYLATISLGDDPETNSHNATSSDFLNTKQIFTYDVPGNIVRIWTDWTTQDFNVNPLTNRLIAPVEYDPSGNVTTWKDDRDIETIFTYDFFNRQVTRSTSEANSTWHYLYSVDDERFMRHNPDLSPATFLTLRDFSGRLLREFTWRNEGPDPHQAEHLPGEHPPGVGDPAPGWGIGLAMCGIIR